MLRDAAAAALKRAADLGEIERDHISPIAAAFVTVVLGANVVAKNRASRDELDQTLTGLPRLVDSYRRT